MKRRKIFPQTNLIQLEIKIHFRSDPALCIGESRQTVHKDWLCRYEFAKQQLRNWAQNGEQRFEK